MGEFVGWHTFHYAGFVLLRLSASSSFLLRKPPIFTACTVVLAVLIAAFRGVFNL